MNTKLFYIVIVFLIFSCKTEGTKKESKYPRMIGNISFDVQKDNSSFVVCNGEDKVAQYFNFGKGLPFEGEKIALEKVFQEKYTSVNVNESGLIRIRFIVNCKGETGRFRVTEMNTEYQKFSFNPEITDQLLSITEQLKGWRIQEGRNIAIDYYQYLIFKIENGQLTEILP